jgi:hypothetical protein
VDIPISLFLEYISLFFLASCMVVYCSIRDFLYLCPLLESLLSCSCLLVVFLRGYRKDGSGMFASVLILMFIEAIWDLLTGNMVLDLVRISDCLYKFIIKITDIIN